ncbi:Uncharacterised protein [uncultured archaeon]|nr:Uncharacterised protein [uncultured archaeon]
METSQLKIEVLNPQPTEQNPYIVKDYPWGRRLRTQQRRYVETIQGKGERYVIQTQDPRDGNWCNPKKSIYSAIIILYKDLSNGYIEALTFSPDYTEEKDLEEFLQKVPLASLSEYQKGQVARARAIYRVRKHIKYTVKTNPTEAEIKESEEREKKVNVSLATLLAEYTGEEKTKLGLK